MVPTVTRTFTPVPTATPDLLRTAIEQAYSGRTIVFADNDRIDGEGGTLHTLGASIRQIQDPDRGTVVRIEVTGNPQAGTRRGYVDRYQDPDGRMEGGSSVWVRIDPVLIAVSPPWFQPISAMWGVPGYEWGTEDVYAVTIVKGSNGWNLSDSRNGGLPGTEIRPGLINANQGVTLALIAAKTAKGYQVFPLVNGEVALVNAANAPVIPAIIAETPGAGFFGGHAGLYVTGDEPGRLEQKSGVLNDDFALFFSN